MAASGVTWDDCGAQKYLRHNVTMHRRASSRQRAPMLGADYEESSMTEMKRLNWSEIAPEGAKALFGIHHYVTRKTDLPEELIHLVFLRVSQINGCAHCIDMHTRDLLKTMAIDKVTLVPVWAEVPHLFSDQYRAALAWAEEVTNVSTTHASEEAYAAIAAVFAEKDLVDLTLVIAAMNAFNRLGAPFRLPVAAKP
jgi:AhpD family alkylhydroperoxidase